MIDFLFANSDSIEEAYRMFRWALTVVGAGVVAIGLVMFFYKPKEESRHSTRSAKLVALISFLLIGVVTIVYAWTWFGIT